MFEWIQKKKNGFVKPMLKKQKTVDHVTGDKIPKSFVFSRGKLPASLRHLEMDLRKLMLPHTALKLKVSFSLPFQIPCFYFFLFLIFSNGLKRGGLMVLQSLIEIV